MVGWAHQSAGPGSMEEAVRATHRADALQPEREILLQMQQRPIKESTFYCGRRSPKGRGP